MKFLEHIFSLKNESNHKIIRFLGLKIKLKTTYLPTYIAEREKCFLKFIPNTHLKLLEFHIVEHCNLNCKSCVHFSPLAREEFLDTETFSRDIKKMAELSGGHIDTINIFGGEPLLHPDLLSFLKITRNFFLNSKIQLVTNGILLLSQKEEFWNTCRENKIIISMTKYPIKLDYEEISKLGEHHNVAVKFFSADKKDSQWHFPLDCDGRQDSVRNFLNCQEANHCTNVYKGKLYICPIASNMRHFNRYFGKNIPVTEYDYIDIHKANNIKEILEFCSKPSPICEYCKIQSRTFDNKWGVSQKDIKEWT